MYEVKKVAYACGNPTETPVCSEPDKYMYLTVSRNSDITLVELVLDDQLMRGFYELRVNRDGGAPADVSCCFCIERNGPVNVITDSDLYDISSMAELDELRNNGYDINYVFSISVDGGCAGLARLGERGFAIAQGYGSMYQYHEYGHTKGLDDCGMASDVNKLMYSNRDNPGGGGWDTTLYVCNKLKEDYDDD